MTKQWEDVPSSDQAAAWEVVLSGSAERVLKQFEADQAHRRKIEVAEARTVRLGQMLGFACVLVLTGVAWHLADLGDTKAAAVVIGMIAALVGLFVAGRARVRRTIARTDGQPLAREDVTPLG